MYKPNLYMTANQNTNFSQDNSRWEICVLGLKNTS